MNQDSKQWDEIHKKHSGLNDRHSPFSEEKEKLFPRGSLICDLGGGTGSDVLYFLKNGHSVVLLDISEFALNASMKKAADNGFSKKLATYQTDFGLHKLPLKDNSIDIAYSRISLNYFPMDETEQIFIDIYKTLKHGGSAYITLKSPKDVKEMEYLEMNATNYEPNVYILNGQLKSRFSLDQIKEMGENIGISGFKVNPYKEEMIDPKTGHKQIVLQNEIFFNKK